jgi:hypothetical protein
MGRVLELETELARQAITLRLPHQPSRHPFQLNHAPIEVFAKPAGLESFSSDEPSLNADG